MGWASETSRGVTTITGPIGDPLAIQIVAEFVGNIEFDEHVWICQIRRTVLDDEAIDLVWREDATEVTVTAATVTDENPTGQITTACTTTPAQEPVPVQSPVYPVNEPGTVSIVTAATELRILNATVIVAGCCLAIVATLIFVAT